jgi:hypothetical protein
MQFRVDPARLARVALVKCLFPALAYLVVLRWVNLPVRRIPAAIIHSIIGRRQLC